MRRRGKPTDKLRISVCAAMFVPMAGLTACVSASLEDAAPRPEQLSDIADTGTTADAVSATDPGPQQQPSRDNSFVDEGATRNDEFPTFEIMPQGATEQLSEEDKRAILAEMDAIRSARGSGASSAAADQRYNELKSIANTHGLETKQQIEGQ